ncbi:hypothetical protein BC477_02600 [Clavibacter michiganensis subsp. michiganensis]|uniref:Uncharacterized protein n=2 Tax=Clavibacter michiganensis subsp. michiganensis TaxID=33013 RepID=A0A251XJS6_CLAMM|nr:hypothetical protein [Clavibacter michiganensis]OUD86857.1 hypothetical protein BC477_02600 [Clavibacter michiganensis subsp. michiganensis]OUE03600.1 hypothetical protein CMMCAS07_01535 [Clavibacter michiganensis subsp. michiganensis]CAN02376.1 hypothetical protein CMM_2304 [Clavibacter michiganensis subsp. michiganensis NCPPB 382]
MAKLTRGDLLEVLRTVRSQIDSAEFDLEVAREGLRAINGGNLDSIHNVGAFIAGQAPRWRAAYTRIAEAEAALASKQREWNGLMRQAQNWTDEALSLAVIEWCYETQQVDLDVQPAAELWAHRALTHDPAADVRIRLAMSRGGYPLP